MAKLIMPLLSIGASGKIGDALVFFPWKGIKCVRKYVIPANPKTAGQQAQRSKLTAAVDQYHLTAFENQDITALRRYASIQSKPMSQFNIFCREHIKAAADGKEFHAFWGESTSNIQSTSMTVAAKSDEGLTDPNIRWGYSATFMPTVVSCTETAGNYMASIVDATPGTILYFQFFDTGGAEAGISGIYTEKTKAA